MDDFYDALATASPVRLLMTPVQDLATCQLEDRAIRIVAHYEQNDFDHIPVVQNYEIVGIFDRYQRPRSGVVADHYRPLAPGYLIGDRASVFSFIERADTQRCCIVVGERGVVGLVTVSDLQKLPVQVALFGLTAQFEQLVSAHLRSALGDPDQRFESVLGYLTRKQAETVRLLQKRNEEMNLDIDWVSPLSLGHKLRALQAVKPGLMNWDNGERVRKLRDSIAHGKAFARTYDLIRELVSSKRAIIHLISHLRQELPRV